MKIAPAVKKETGHIALGTALGVAIMLVVFAVLGRFDAGVAVSGILGGALAVANFFLLGLTVQKIANGEPEDRARLPRRAASSAASFTRFSRSAPAKPAVDWAMVFRFTSGARGLLRE